MLPQNPPTLRGDPASVVMASSSPRLASPSEQRRQACDQWMTPGMRSSPATSAPARRRGASRACGSDVGAGRETVPEHGQRAPFRLAFLPAADGRRSSDQRERPGHPVPARRAALDQARLTT